MVRDRQAAHRYLRAPSPILVTVFFLTLLAGIIRLQGLAASDGSLTKDEAGEALAASGVLQTGLPVWPTGRVHPRALLNSYLVAMSFAVFGQHDIAARLPSVVAGALLVPILFLLGRALGGTVVGLAVAMFAAVTEPLVEWSRRAWPPSVFLLVFTLAIYCCYRGFVGRRGGWQVAGAAGFVLAVLSYEFAVLLPAGLALYVVWSVVRGRWDWYRGRATLSAFVLMAGGLGLFWILALAFRAGTLAGSLGEVTTYLSPGLSLNGANFYLQELLSGYAVLIGAVLLGLPLLARARPRGTAYLTCLLVVAFCVPSFAIQVKRTDNYALAVLPLLAVLSAACTVRLAERARRFYPTSPLARALPVLALLAVFGGALFGDMLAVGHRLQQRPPGPTWLQVARQEGIRSTDLLLTEGPEVAYFYLGHAEFYVYSQGENYRRYNHQASDAIRSIQTGSVLLRQEGDFRRLVERPNLGRNLWVIGHEDRLRRLIRAMDPDLWPSLVDSADRIIQTPDDWVLIKVTLPRRFSPEITSFTADIAA